MTTEAAANIVLTYWPIKGLGAACRLALLHAVGVDGFVDRQLPDDSVGNAMLDAFTEEAMTAGQPMLNLPFLQLPGSPLITQSSAVLKAIGRRYGLAGHIIAEEDLVDEVLWQLSDFDAEYVKLEYEAPKEHFAEWKADFDRLTLPYYYGGLDRLLRSRQLQWFGGSSVSVADFKLYACIDATRALHVKSSMAAEVEAYPHILAWLEKAKALPSVQAYEAHPMSRIATNGDAANWGGSTWLV